MDVLKINDDDDDDDDDELLIDYTFFDLGKVRIETISDCSMYTASDKKNHAI